MHGLKVTRWLLLCLFVINSAAAPNAWTKDQATSSNTLASSRAEPAPAPPHAPPTLPATPIPQGSVVAATQTILSEGFEEVWPPVGGLWRVTSNGNPTWNDTNYRAYAGTWSAWCAASSLNPATQDYPNNMNAWMIYGPFSLTNATAAHMTFKFWLQSEPTYDFLYWRASTDNNLFHGAGTSGNSQGWQSRNVDFSNVPGFGSMLGRSQVWVAFQFVSDPSTTGKGAFVDAIVIEKTVSTVPTVAITGPNGGNNVTVAGSSIMVTAHASDQGCDLAEVRCENLDTGETRHAPVGAGTCTVDTTFAGLSLQQGPNRIVVTARDQDGLEQSDSMVVTRNRAPTVSITGPNGGNNVLVRENLVTIAGDTLDGDCNISEIRAENLRTGEVRRIPEGGTTCGRNFSFDNFGIPFGPNQFVVTVTDALGANGSDAIVITRGSPPTLSILSPNGGNDTTVSVPTVTIGGDADDPDGDITGVQLRNTATGYTAEGPQSFQFQNVPLQAGANTITVTTTDSLGFTATDSIIITYAPPPPANGVEAWVRDARLGSNVQGATVTLMRHDGTGAPLTCLTASDGRCQIRALSAGAYDATVSHPQYATTASLPIDVPASGFAPLDVPLRPIPSVSMTTDRTVYAVNTEVLFTMLVRHPITGQRLDAVEVWVEDPGVGASNLVGTTGADGVLTYRSFLYDWAVENARTLTYEFVAGEGRTPVEVRVNGPPTLEITTDRSDYLIGDETTFTIRATDAGQPLAGVELWVEDPFRRLSGPVGTTGPDGRAQYRTTIASVFAEEIILYALHPDYAPASQSYVLQAGPRPMTYQRDVPPGWSGVALFHGQASLPVASLFPQPPQRALLWDTAANIFQVWPPQPGYRSFDQLLANTGYLVRHATGAPLSAASLPIAAADIALAPGWNLIGVSIGQDVLPLTGVRVVANGTSYSFEAARQQGMLSSEFYRLQPNGSWTPAPYLLRGEAYFVQATQPAMLQLLALGGFPFTSINADGFSGHMPPNHEYEFGLLIPAGVGQINVSVNHQGGEGVRVCLYNPGGQLVTETQTPGLTLSVGDPAPGRWRFKTISGPVPEGMIITGSVDVGASGVTAGYQYAQLNMTTDGEEAFLSAAWGFATGRCELDQTACLVGDLGTNVVGLVPTPQTVIADEISDYLQGTTNAGFAGYHTTVCFLGKDQNACNEIGNDILLSSFGFMGLIQWAGDVPQLAYKASGLTYMTLKGLSRVYKVIPPKIVGHAEQIPDRLWRLDRKYLTQGIENPANEAAAVNPTIIEHLKQYNSRMGEKFWTKVNQEVFELEQPTQLAGVLELTDTARDFGGRWSYKVTSPVTGNYKELDVVGQHIDGQRKEFYVSEVKTWFKDPDTTLSLAQERWYHVGEDGIREYEKIIKRLEFADEVLTAHAGASRVHKIVVATGSVPPPDDIIEIFAERGIIVMPGIK